MSEDEDDSEMESYEDDLRAYLAGHKSLNKKIEIIMRQKLFQANSHINFSICPMCKCSVDKKHYESAHPNIIARGCIYCDKPLPENLTEYYAHLKYEHADNLADY